MDKSFTFAHDFATMKERIGSDEPVRRFLLGLLATNPQMFLPICAVLDAAEWAQLQHMARQHRLEPLLYDRSRNETNRVTIPPLIWRQWEAAFRNSAMEALALQSTLIRLDGILTAAGIAYASLKGARLAWRAYPHPALRPMRDLDILVCSAQMHATWDTLVVHGFNAASGCTPHLEGALDHHKHLPALRDPASGIHVEIHSRLFEHIDAAHADAAMRNNDDLLANRIWLPLGQTNVSFLPSAEALIHLIVHSAYEHHFENGPQVLYDLAAQMKDEKIDWPRFWQLAREGGWERGCSLLLQLTEQFMGKQPIDWGGEPREAIPSEVLDKSALLMLQDTDLRQDLAVQVQLAAQAGSVWGKARRMAAKVLPRREVVAAYAGLARDNPRAWLHYPGWLVSRLGRTLAGKFDTHQQAEASRASVVEAWLGGN